MQGEFLKGDIKDVCAELEREAKRYKGITVGEWLRLRKLERLERVEAEQFGMTEKRFRRELHISDAN